jgi:hypothetical protein
MYQSIFVYAVLGCFGLLILGRNREQYFRPNLTVEQLRALIRNGANADPLKSFVEACRANTNRCIQLCRRRRRNKRRT